MFYLFYLYLCAETFGDILEGKLVNRNAHKCLLAQDMFKSFFTEAILGKLHCPRFQTLDTNHTPS